MGTWYGVGRPARGRTGGKASTWLEPPGAPWRRTWDEDGGSLTGGALLGGRGGGTRRRLAPRLRPGARSPWLQVEQVAVLQQAAHHGHHGQGVAVLGVADADGDVAFGDRMDELEEVAVADQQVTQAAAVEV